MVPRKVNILFHVFPELYQKGGKNETKRKDRVGFAVMTSAREGRIKGFCTKYGFYSARVVCPNFEALCMLKYYVIDLGVLCVRGKCKRCNISTSNMVSMSTNVTKSGLGR